MEKIFDIAKDNEQSWGTLAAAIDGNFNETFDEGYLDYYESPVLVTEGGYYAANGHVSNSSSSSVLHSKVEIPTGAITAKFENIQAFSDGKVIVNFFVDGVWSRDVIAEVAGKLSNYEIEIPEGVSHIGFNYRNTDDKNCTFRIGKKVPY